MTRVYPIHCDGILRGVVYVDQPRPKKERKSVSTWPDDHVAYLREMVTADEHSMSEMAKRLNDRFQTRYTRSGVIGKVHRMGLSTSRTAKPAGAPRPVYRSPAVSRTRLTVPRTGEVPVTRTVNAASLNVTLYELEEGMCKWMTTDTTYCGVATAGRRVSYCTCHQNAGTEPARYRGSIWGVNKRPATR